MPSRAPSRGAATVGVRPSPSETGSVSGMTSAYLHMVDARRVSASSDKDRCAESRSYRASNGAPQDSQRLRGVS